MIRCAVILFMLAAPAAYAQSGADSECECEEYPLRLEVFTWVESARRAVKLAEVEDGGTVLMSHRAADAINIRAIYDHPDAYQSAIRVREDRAGGFRGMFHREYFAPWTAFGDEVNVELNSLSPWVVDVQFYDDEGEQLIDRRISFSILRSGVAERARLLVTGDPTRGAVKIEDKAYLLDPDQPRLLGHDLPNNRRDSRSDVVLQGDYLAQNWQRVTAIHYDEEDELLYLFRTGVQNPEEDIFFHRFTPEGSSMDVDEAGVRLPAGLNILGVRKGGRILYSYEQEVERSETVLNQDSTFKRMTLRYISLDNLDLDDPELDLKTVLQYSRGLLELTGELNYKVSAAVEYEGVYYVSDPVSARIFAYDSFGPWLRDQDIDNDLVAYGNTNPVASFVYNDTLYVGDPRYQRLYQYPLNEEDTEDEDSN